MDLAMGASMASACCGLLFIVEASGIEWKELAADDVEVMEDLDEVDVDESVSESELESVYKLVEVVVVVVLVYVALVCE